jgi:hypothetical protein
MKFNLISRMNFLTAIIAGFCAVIFWHVIWLAYRGVTTGQWGDLLFYLYPVGAMAFLFWLVYRRLRKAAKIEALKHWDDSLV